MLQEDDALPRATEPPFLSALRAKNDTTNLFGYKLGESAGKETIQTFKPSRRCLRSDKLVNCHV